VAETPVVAAAGDAVLLPFADESSIVQTRFATTVLALMLAYFGEDVQPAIADAEASLARPLLVDPCEFEQFVFLGRGWTVGLAFEAALKFREAGGAWAEAYPAMEYRHGPISLADPETAVIAIGPIDATLDTDIRATGATLVDPDPAPLATLVLTHRLAIRLAEIRGLDPDLPRNLTRSVVLP
jgi:fructoselysine-6-P-deglycase FrlB-like protein